MTALPTIGGDKDSWGTKLVAWLESFANADGTLQTAPVQAALGGSRPIVSDTDPSPTLASGTEYVWFKLDGSGNLIDIITGKVA
jgi:hypothetical protein